MRDSISKFLDDRDNDEFLTSFVVPAVIGLMILVAAAFGLVSLTDFL